MLRSRILEDTLRHSHLRSDSMDRYRSLGTAIDYVPVVVTTNADCTQGANIGEWIRHNELLIYWFLVVVGSSPGTGTMYLQNPQSILLDEMGGVSGPGGGTSHVGEWEAQDNSANVFAKGWIEPDPSNTSRVHLHMLHGLPGSGSNPWTLATGDLIWGRVVAKVAPAVPS